MVVQGVAALYQGLDIALAEGIPLHVVPAQAVGQGVRLPAVGPDAAGILRGGHGVQAGLAQQLRACQGAAEGSKIGGGGVDAAGADGVQGILGQGPGIGAPVNGSQIAGVKVPAGGEGAVQVQGSQDLLVHIVHEGLAGDGLHHQLRQGEAVVAVDAEGAGIRSQPLGGELLQQRVVGFGAGLAEQHGAGEAGAQDAGGVVQQHPDGDVFVPLIRHLEVRQVPGHRGVQGDFAVLHQLHDGHGGVDLADGADAVQLLPGHQAILRPGEVAHMAGEDDLPVLPQGVLQALGAAVLGGVGGGGVRQGLEIRSRGLCLRRRGGDRQTQGQKEGQDQGLPACVQFVHSRFLSRPAGRLCRTLRRDDSVRIHLPPGGRSSKKSGKIRSNRRSRGRIPVPGVCRKHKGGVERRTQHRLIFWIKAQHNAHSPVRT